MSYTPGKLRTVHRNLDGTPKAGQSLIVPNVIPIKDLDGTALVSGSWTVAWDDEGLLEVDVPPTDGGVDPIQGLAYAVHHFPVDATEIPPALGVQVGAGDTVELAEWTPPADPPAIVLNAQQRAEEAADRAEGAVDVHAARTTLVHGIPDTAELETKTGAQGRVDTHNADGTGVHGIVDTAQLATQAWVQALVDAAVATLLGGAPPAALDSIFELAEKFTRAEEFFPQLAAAVASAQLAQAQGETARTEAQTAAGVATGAMTSAQGYAAAAAGSASSAETFAGQAQAAAAIGQAVAEAPTGLTAGMLGTTRLWTLAANFTVPALPSPGSAGAIRLLVKQPAAGGPFTLTFPAVVEWVNDAPAPSMPTLAGAELLVSLLWTGTAWRGFYEGVFFP